jgi:hypothetical protein
LSEETFSKIVHVWSQVIPDLESHPDLLTKFVYLIEKIDGLPGMERRFHREGFSFYHAISKKRTLSELEEILKIFFEAPPISTVQTLEGKPDDTISAERLGGIQGEQVMFAKKIGEAEFYGALWPWKDKRDVVTVHLGVCAPGIKDDDYQFMSSAMKGHLTESTSEKIDASVRGRLQGVSLSSYLQMSEMEGSTCTLMVQAGNKTGTLHLLNGNLIDAETASLKHKEAAFAILSWENAEIDIQKPIGRKENQIGLPLMSILMEALKKKDESEYVNEAREIRLEGQINLEQDQPIPGPESRDDSKVLAASESGEVSTQAEKATDGSGGPEQGTEPASTQPAVLEDKKAEAAVSDKKDSAKESKGRGKKAGKRNTLGPGGKKKRTPLIAVAVGVILLMGAGTFWVMQGNGGSAADEYAALMENMEGLADDAEKEKRLNAFIDSYTDDPVYTDQAMQELFTILSRMEASDYEKATQAVFDLPLNRQYHQEAEKIFNAFLQRYPDSRFSEDVSKKLAEILALTDDAHFSELSELNPRDYILRLKAYDTYLDTYPDGRHNKEVEELAMQTLKASYREFLIKIDKCKKRKKWDDCVSTCRQYRETFQRYMNMDRVDEIEANVLELKALHILRAKTEGVDDETVRTLYLGFLKSYPTSSERNRMEQRVAKIEKEMADSDEWVRVKTAGQDTTQALSHRVALVRRYVDQNPQGPYLIEAENLLWKLEKQSYAGTTAKSAAQKGTGNQKDTTGIATDKSKKTTDGQDNAVRLETLRRNMSSELANTKGRYVVTPDKTIQDKVTGLVWTMLDSFQVLGRCVDYRQAVKYIDQLQDGGHDDWQLPTSAELAGIYQNSPYFPASNAEWYWSSEVYEKGYQTIANIVSANPETMYRKKSAEVRKCGSVRAVRP